MPRWHDPACTAPKFLVNAQVGCPACQTCGKSFDPKTTASICGGAKPPAPPPPDEPIDQMGLWWPKCVKYTTGAVAGEPSQFGVARSQTLSQEISEATIYPRTLAEHEFRLLHLSPASSPEDPIHARLGTYRPDDCPEYETVSYCWGGEDGDATPSRPVFLGPHWDVLWQTRNCWEMLKLLRRRDHDRVLWVDAICINQGNTAEKGVQVAKMGQIYSQAARVIVHLGQDLVHPIPPERSYLSRANFGEIPTPSLGGLFKRRYFQRIWIIQELVLSSEARLRLGWTEYTLNHHTIKTLQAQDSQLACLDSIPWFRSVTQRLLAPEASSDNNLDISGILNLTWSSQATDQRDKLFGVLGLIPGLPPSILPDYSLSLQHIFTGIFSFCLLGLRDARVLGAASGVKGWGRYPSWVPPWRPEVMDPGNTESSADFRTLFRIGTSLVAGGGTASAQKTTPKAALYHIPWYHGASISASSASLTVNLVHVAPITRSPRAVDMVEDARRFIFDRVPCTPEEGSNLNVNMILTTRYPLDGTMIVPGKDHIFALQDGTMTRPLFLLLRRTHEALVFRVVCACDKLEIQDAVHGWGTIRRSIELDDIQFSVLENIERDINEVLTHLPSWRSLWSFQFVLLTNISRKTVLYVVQGVLNEERGEPSGFWERYSAVMEGFVPRLETWDMAPDRTAVVLTLELERDRDALGELFEGFRGDKHPGFYTRLGSTLTPSQLKEQHYPFHHWKYSDDPREPWISCLDELPSEPQAMAAGGRVYIAASLAAVRDMVAEHTLMHRLRRLNVGNRLVPDEEDEASMVLRGPRESDKLKASPPRHGNNPFRIDGSTYTVTII